ncbi:MAG: hypothetical protein K6A23_02370 [Butyrivibrio sp.]|nr:hypothetical protein [Butyrivibrio sp.]
MLKKGVKWLVGAAATFLAIAALSLTPAASHKAEAAAEVAYGIDVAKYQGNINWQQVKASGVKFAFIRVGTTKKGLDEQFVNNINGANAAGIRAGVYIYSYATTVEQAAAEANLVLQWIAPYTVSFPVAFDIEDSVQKNLSTAQLQEIINTFCGIINGQGYQPMVYSSRNWFNNKIGDVAWDKWIAQYNTSLVYSGSYAMWQSSSHGSVSGISTRVDVNHLYKDYFSMMPQEGFTTRNGQTFYYHNYRRMSGWINLSGAKYLANADGVIQTGWYNDGTYTYYLNPSQGGLASVGFTDIDGSKYYFDENGYLHTGLLNIGAQYYYADATGVLHNGFVSLEDGVRYFDEQYVMHTGLTEVAGNLYYLGDNGIMQSGLIGLESGLYYFGADGAAITGWYSDEAGRRFYFAANHCAVTGLQTIDNAVYLFNPDGTMFTGWSGEVTARYYFGGDGKMLTGWQTIDGQVYYFDGNGIMVTGLVTIGNAVYYFEPLDGHRTIGFVGLADGYRYFDANDGHMLTNMTAVLDGVECTFDANGILVSPAGWVPGTPAPTTGQ